MTAAAGKISYCSAFPDTDSPFGSAGPFEGFSPQRGCFEANPPFEPAIIAEMYNRMELLLERAEKDGQPLSFIVIMPSWESDSCDTVVDKVKDNGEGMAVCCKRCKFCVWTRIARSRFAVRCLTLLKGNHVYTEVPSQLCMLV